MAITKKDEFSAQNIALADFAKALSHPARIEIIKLLAKRNSCVCGELVEELPLSQSTVSQHLKALKEAGLIQGEIEGPKTCYCLNVEGIKRLCALLPKFTDDLSKFINTKKRCC